MVSKRSRKPRPGNGDGSIPSPSANYLEDANDYQNTHQRVP